MYLFAILKRLTPVLKAKAQKIVQIPTFVVFLLWDCPSIGHLIHWIHLSLFVFVHHHAFSFSYMNVVGSTWLNFLCIIHGEGEFKLCIVLPTSLRRKGVWVKTVKERFKKRLLYYWTLSQKVRTFLLLAGVLLNCKIHGLLIKVLDPSAGPIRSREHVFDFLLVSHINFQKHIHNYIVYKTLFLSCKMYSLLVRGSDFRVEPIWQHHENAFNLKKSSSP